MALCHLLLSEPEVLLLDDPTNDLDVNTLRVLEDAILNFTGCAVIISHDRSFLDRVAKHILAFEGNSELIWFDGNFSDYQEDFEKRHSESANRLRRVSYKKLKRDYPFNRVIRK